MVHNSSTDEDGKKGKEALEGLGYCVQETLIVSLASGWRTRCKFANDASGVIYLLRRDNEALKVGQTSTKVTSWQGRWDDYLKAYNNCGKFDIIAWSIDEEPVRQKLLTPESTLRKAFCGKYPPDCPWDNTQEAGGPGPMGERLGRVGPGVPGEKVSDPSLGHWDTANICNWVKGANPNPPQAKRPSKEDFEKQLDIFAAQFGGRNGRGINAALANHYNVNAGQITRWRQEWML